MFLALFSFLDAAERMTGPVPTSLEPREQSYTMLLVGILSLSFLMISFSRNNNARSLITVFEVFFRESSAVEIQLKENMRIGSMSSLILILNYLISFSLCNFIFFQRILLLDDTISMALAFSIPFVFLGIETLGVLVVGVLSGEWKRISFTLLNTFNIAQFSGLLFSVIGLFWIMSPGADKLFLSLFLAVISLKVLSRLLKNSMAVLGNGVRWYYIMLYLCTLEILPLFVLSNFVLRSFMK
ncbi:MAG: hypothetical protein RIT43_2016 [Bacteroidota bacterium]|jgi:hypothetical protein